MFPITSISATIDYCGDFFDIDFAPMKLGSDFIRAAKF